ncbi:hypothetical protein ELH44_06820 [Rhizobium ruizarguesonis]|uniref:hypothetical protein n=1 Tax=Rhizobium ruizarguesonis TaxID=2081791 RepID=UPI001031373F|nr:hypothetical protein [Rhizobium ruizarguesonis]TBB53397.1 hypothetical protein ELH44_06820 [Rhizobium ruizarguesonis]
MFTLVHDLTVWWPVKVIEPDPEKPGSYVEQTFDVLLEILDRDYAKERDELRGELLKSAEKDSSEENLKHVQAELENFDTASFTRVIKDWRGVVDKDKKVIPFTNEIFAAALKLERIRIGINRAYQEAISQDKARLGN